MKRLSLLLTLLLIMPTAFAEKLAPPQQDAVEKGPAKRGNFSLPGTQQPGSFLSIGQNILNKGQVQFNLMLDDYMGHNDSYIIDISPNFIYGLSDNLSVLINAPYAPGYKLQGNRSSGFEDMNVQFEYAYYSEENKQYTEQATFLWYFGLPTGSTRKQPHTGLGSVSLLVGTTFLRMYENWYAFVSPGAVFSTPHHSSELGDKYLYQLGFGRNIAACPSKWIFAWLIEIDGQYETRDMVNGQINLDSGGNVIFITPSLWYSREHFIIQAGVGKACAQNLFGNQDRNTFVWAANFGWTFDKPAPKPQISLNPKQKASTAKSV